MFLTRRRNPLEYSAVILAEAYLYFNLTVTNSDLYVCFDEITLNIRLVKTSVANRMIYRQDMNGQIQNTAKAGARGRQNCCTFHQFSPT